MSSAAVVIGALRVKCPINTFVIMEKGSRFSSLIQLGEGAGART